MFAFRCYPVMAAIGVTVLVAGCNMPPQPTPIMGYQQRPAFTGYVARLPRPVPPPQRPAVQQNAEPPLTDAEKAALFRQFDAWQKQRLPNVAAGDPVAVARSTPSRSSAGAAASGEPTP